MPMTASINELKHQRAEILRRCKATTDRAKAERRELTDTEANTIEADLERVDELDRDLAHAENEENRKMARASRSSRNRVEYIESAVAGLGRSNGRMSADTASDDNPLNPARRRQSWQEAFAAAGWRERPRYKASDLDNLNDGGFRSFGDFITSIIASKSGNFDRRLEALQDVQLNAQQSAYHDPSGGYITPERFKAELIMSAEESAPWLAQRRMYDAAGSELLIPALADRDRSSDELAGLAMPRVNENGTMTDDTITFERRRLALSKAAALVKVSNELLTDAAIGVDAALRQVFARRVAFRQSIDFISGSGAGEPLGVLTALAASSLGPTISVAKEGGQSADTINGANIINVRAKISPAALPRSLWLAHPGTIGQLYSAHVSGTNSDRFLLNGDQLFDRPIFYTEAASLLGDQGDIMLVDPSAYAYAMRPIRIDLSTHVAFTADQVAFRLVLRDAGLPTQFNVLTDAKGYQTSEFVTLDARA